MPTDFPPSIVAVICEDPAAFWRVYWTFTRPLLWVLAAPIAGVIVLPPAARPVALAALLLMLLYLPIVNLGTSLRGIGPVIPIAMACLGLVLDRLVKALSARRLARGALAIIAAAATVYVARPWIEANRAFINGAAAGYEWRRDVEHELRAQGVTSPLQVYGDAGFHFVTPDGPGWYSYMPHFNGGWPRLDLYALDRVLPEFATTSLDAFVADGERRGVTHVVLSGTAGYLLPALGEIYEGRRIDPRLELTATVGGMKIFRLRS